MDLQEPNNFGYALTPNEDLKPIRKPKRRIRPPRPKEKHISCTMCYYTTARYDSLRRHVRAIHNHEKSNQCPQCPHICARADNLKRHIEKMHSNPNVDITTAKLAKIPNAEAYSTDEPNEDQVLPCQECDFKPNSILDLQNHIRIAHPKGKNQDNSFECSLCKYSSARAANLRRHVDKVHTKNKSAESATAEVHNAIDSKPTVQGLLEDHSDWVHSPKDQQVPPCEPSDLKPQVASQMEAATPKERQCSICPYNATRPDDLRRHVVTVHHKTRNFQCSQCPYSSARADNLRRHVNVMHLKIANSNSDKPKNHKCHICPYKTAYNSTLKRHMEQVHEQRRDHRCDLCDYAAATLTYLDQHVKAVHYKIRKHGCQFCGRGFACAQTLKRHVRLMHVAKTEAEPQDCK